MIGAMQHFIRSLILGVSVLLASFQTIAAQHNHTVHLIFSNHLDVGFDGIQPYVATDNEVISVYFDVYFPKAVEVARKLRQRGGPERLRYMTQSFLVSLYLDCPPSMGLRCPGPMEVAEFEEAVKQGDIYWHAFPHNAQIEAMNEELLEYAIQMTHALDERFGLPHKAMLSQRDVPGMTRAALPMLAKHNVRGISVGVNGGSAPPAVPHNRPFVWRDLASGAEVVAIWHPGGYGGYSRELDCVEVGGFHHVLCPYWRQDNQGPPSVDEVLQVFDAVRGEFPGADVIASSFDDYLEPLLEAAPGMVLPVVTAEIGDTWVVGIQSDPNKISEFRSLLRLRRAIHWDDPEPFYLNFSRMLLKVPEHTWGLAIGHFLADEEHYSNAELAGQLQGQNLHYRAVADAWRHMRGWNQWALDALGQDPRAAEVIQRVADDETLPWRGYGGANSSRLFQTRGLEEEEEGGLGAWQRVEHANIDVLMIETSSWRIGICTKTGSISRLQRMAQQSGKMGAGPEWASDSCPLMQLQYSAYREGDYEEMGHMASQYAYNSWILNDYGKKGADAHAPTRREDATPMLEAIWKRQVGFDARLSIRMDLALPGWTNRDYGGCAKGLRVTLADPVDGTHQLYAEVVCRDKTPTRLPEAMWVRFRPDVNTADLDSWRLTKLAKPIHPLAVLRNGSHSMHAVGDEGFYISSQPDANSSQRQRLRIRSLDAMLVSPGHPNPFPNVRTKPDLAAGMAVNLWNNIWGTNYVMWVPYNEGERDLRFRFVLAADDISADDLAQEADVDREQEVLQQLRQQFPEDFREDRPQGEGLAAAGEGGLSRA